ncbi:anchored repeat-type ABC transporter, permease subunit [Corynebacterium sp. KPL1818]|uniref:anchored repeat-type ABC transporter permease subunit n=1 Tax=Corynebacterium sp. KPL1818 TaxID=1203559 RepID=UPI0003B87BFB|nr:anchored repeat-type ABC transporter permease subunit [Corynebacterium sp. KPL1818]ERS57698.1 anchored repeat-type ABC transporter, permease subunit [Corynebacterium sp. KPL1818]
MIDISFIDFLRDLTNPHLDFLARAVGISLIAAIVCGVIGCYVVLRGMAFIGDAVSHAVFPGLAIAFALQASVLLGGAVAGAVVAVLIAAFSQRNHVRADSIIGIFFAAAFALGMVIISRTDGYSASLTSFLFGSLTGVSRTDITVAASVCLVVLAVVVAFGPQLNATCLDRETARAMGLPVFALDIILYLCVTAAVVISVSTIGNILVLALLITPAATARLLTANLTTMMFLSAIIGAVCSFFGIYLAWAIDLPAGATIVLTLTVLFLIVWALHPFLRSRRKPGHSSPRVPANASENTPRKETIES